MNRKLLSIIEFYHVVRCSAHFTHSVSVTPSLIFSYVAYTQTIECAEQAEKKQLSFSLSERSFLVFFHIYSTLNVLTLLLLQSISLNGLMQTLNYAVSVGEMPSRFLRTFFFGGLFASSFKSNIQTHFMNILIYCVVNTLPHTRYGQCLFWQRIFVSNAHLFGHEGIVKSPGF